MPYLSGLWKWLTEKSLEQSTGKLDTAFFESVYRISYASGISSAANQSLPYRIYKIVIKTIIILFISSEIWYLFEVSHSLDTIIDNINVTIIHLIVAYRYKIMEDYSEIYIRLTKSMESPTFDISTPGRKKTFDHWKKINQKFYKLLLTLATSTLGIWYIYPLLDDQEYNFTVALQIPIEYKTPVRYAIAYVITLTMFHFISYFVIVNDLMLQTYLIHMICQFTVLSDCFENILMDCCGDIRDLNNDKLFSDESFRRNYLRRLGYLVEQHKFLLNNSSHLRTILSRPMLGQLAASGMLICLVGYQVTTTVSDSVPKFLMSLLYLAYNMYGFYILCRWCDEIKIQSENIRQAVYFSGWERGAATVPGVRVRLMLVIMRASRPLVLTAGGLYDVSLTSYTTLVKTSYSALTVLLRMRQRSSPLNN